MGQHNIIWAWLILVQLGRGIKALWTQSILVEMERPMFALVMENLLEPSHEKWTWANLLLFIKRPFDQVKWPMVLSNPRK